MQSLSPWGCCDFFFSKSYWFERETRRSKPYVVVQSLSHVQLFATPWTAALQASLSFLSARACSDSCALSQRSHPTISSISFSSCLLPFPASGSFPVTLIFTSSGKISGASALLSLLPMNMQDWFPLGLTGLISLQSKGLKSLPQHHNLNASILWHSAFFMVHGPTLTSAHDYWKKP